MFYPHGTNKSRFHYIACLILITNILFLVSCKGADSTNQIPDTTPFSTPSMVEAVTGEVSHQITSTPEYEAETNKMNIKIKDEILVVTLSDNTTTQALKEYLSSGAKTIQLEDYAGMEKVGALGISLPQNNESMNTTVGDVILYQGNRFVIYYGENSWSLTPLGKIEGVSESTLKEILGNGSVEVILSLE